jgi:hypothetical protein
MNVVPLHAVVQKAEASTRRTGKGSSDGDEDIVAPKRRQTVVHPQCDVRGTAAVVHWSTGVRYAPAAGCRLPSCTFTSPAPRGRGRKYQLSIRSRHLESGTYYTKLASMSRAGVCLGQFRIECPGSTTALAEACLRPLLRRSPLLASRLSPLGSSLGQSASRRFGRRACRPAVRVRLPAPRTPARACVTGAAPSSCGGKGKPCARLLTPLRCRRHARDSSSPRSRVY